MTQTNSNIGDLIRKLENDYISGTTTVSKYVDFSMYEKINTIDAYLNDKHTSGEYDSQGREKPFFNISLGARNIWYRATDIDRKNIRIKATKRSDVITSFLANAKLQQWMDRDNFGQFLNDWGLGLAGYGSYVSKFIEKDGELYSMVIDWQRIICDAVNFDANPKIEILELTPAELRRKKEYDQDMVERLIDAVEDRELIGGQQKDNKADYIKLYEIHGELPLSYLTGDDKDEKEYVQQMHVVSFVEGKEKGSYDDFDLVSGREEKDPYFITHLIKKQGVTLSTGSVESLFQAQWMVNHNIKAIKDQLDLASKLIFQTSDGNFIGQNALNAIQTGDILIHKPNEPLTQLANSSHDITSLLEYKNQWQVLSQEISSTPDILKGNNMPSGTAFRQAAIIQEESHSNFEIMVENKGLAIEQMLRKYIIPYLKKQLDTTDEIVATLDTYGIDRIDELYIKNEPVRRTNRRLVERVIQEGKKPLSTNMPTQQDQMAMLQEETDNVQSELRDMGSERYIKPSDVPSKKWKELFKDFEWEAKVEIVNENTNKDAVLTTLSSVFQTIANPATAQLLQTPEGKLVFNKILSETGAISEMELSTLKNKPAPMVGSAVGQIIK